MRLKMYGAMTVQGACMAALLFFACLPVFAQNGDQSAGGMDVGASSIDGGAKGIVGGVQTAFRAAVQKMVIPVDYHWYIGVYGGYANNKLYTSKGYHTYTEYQNGNGFTIGLPVRFQIFSWLGVGAEPMFIQKNYRRQRTEQFSAVYEELTNSFLDFPVYANLSAGFDHLRFYTNLGFFLGAWLDSHVKGTGFQTSENPWDPGAVPYSTSYDEKREFDETRDSLFDGGLFAGLGVQYALSPCTFFVEGRYYYGLSDLQKQYMKNMVPRMNDTWTIQAGVTFNAAIFNIFQKGAK